MINSIIYRIARRSVHLHGRMDKYHPHHKVKLPKHDLDEIRKKLIGTYQGVKFYFVNSEYIRDNIDIDYVLGGNGYRYNYVPEEEIWLEEIPEPGDIAPTILHEFIESHKMAKGWYYDRAHDFASHYEKLFRKDYKPTKDIFKDFIKEYERIHGSKLAADVTKFENPPIIKSIKDAKIFFKIPTFRQATPDTCGKAVVISVLGYYGYDVSEYWLKDFVSIPKEGAYPETIAQIGKSFGLKTDIIRSMTPDQIQGYLDKKTPVILELQAWGDKEHYTKDWKDGHYVVACGYDDGGFYLMDPGQYGYSYIPTDKLIEAWHDKDGHRKNENLGIVFYGKPPKYDPDGVRLTLSNMVRNLAKPF